MVRRVLCSLAALLFVAASPARAQIFPDPDGIGLYFDTGPYSEPDGGILGNYLPAYRSGDPAQWRPMTPVSGSIDEPVAFINPTISPAESTPWSQVKNLYR